MGRTLHDALGWVEHGTELGHAALAGPFPSSTALTGWTGAHLIAHLAANADAIGNLVAWAATGVPTPMYSSPEQRAADIEAGSHRSEAELREWYDASAARLAAAMSALTPAQWQAEVVTAQGRTVPASETPWMRAREVMVHAVDLGGATFADLPTDFLEALGDDIVAKRNTATPPAVSLVPTDAATWWELTGTGAPVTIEAPLADVVAYLAGRPADVPAHAPALGPWL